MILKSQQEKIEKERRSQLRQLRGVFTLTIQTKLSLIIGGLILGVIVLLTATIVTRQTATLTDNADKLAQTLLQSVAATAKDELLLESAASIQDMITNIKRLNMSGLRRVVVSDREGKVVAHSETNDVDTRHLNPLSQAGVKPRQLPTGEQKMLSKSNDVVIALEDDENYFYVDSIFVRKPSTRELVYLGASELVFSKEEIQKPIAEQQRLILVFGAVVFLVSQAIGLLLSKQIVSAVVSISNAARKVAEGDLNVRIITKGKDELAELAREFNKMVIQIRQKIEMEKFLSEMTVEMISDRTGSHDENGAEVFRRENGEELVEKREIAAFFSDIRGFTSLSEKLEPEDALQIVNVYLDMQTQVIKRYGGVVDKFMGDGMMCLFRGQDMTDRAILAAVEIQTSIFNTNKMRAAHGLDYAAVGIGVSVGKAVLGNVGSQKRKDYTAIGDVVNLASRLCSIADAYSILVSESVIRNLRQKHSFRTMQTIKVKGKEKPVEVYSLEVNRSQYLAQPSPWNAD